MEDITAHAAGMERPELLAWAKRRSQQKGGRVEVELGAHLFVYTDGELRLFCDRDHADVA